MSQRPVSQDIVILAADDALAGPAALLVVLTLLVVTVLLIRNMDGRLKRLPKEFPPPERAGRQEPPKDDGKGGTSLQSG